MIIFLKRNAWAVKLFFIFAVFLVLILSFETLISSELLRDIITEYSYPGVIAAAFFTGIAGFPIPIITFTPLFTELGLDIILVVISIVVGLTLGDLVTYGLGVAGRKLSRESDGKVLARLEKYAARHRALPLWALFLWASFVPIPNEVLLLPLGLLGYRLIHVLPPLILGNILLNSLVASGVVGIFGVFV